VALLRTLYDACRESSSEEKFFAVEKQLHQPLSHFLPAQSPIWNNVMPQWADKITLHHLLSHTAGIANPVKIILDRAGFDAVGKLLSTPHTVSEIVAHVTPEPLRFEPGT